MTRVPRQPQQRNSQVRMTTGTEGTEPSGLATAGVVSRRPYDEYGPPMLATTKTSGIWHNEMNEKTKSLSVRGVMLVATTMLACDLGPDEQGDDSESIGSDTQSEDGGGDGDGDGDGDRRPDCERSEECIDQSAPFCDAELGACVACSATKDPDSACASIDPNQPLCVSNVCVACTASDGNACKGSTPVCDPETNSCVACSSHEQCPATACNFAAGSCIDPVDVLYVDGDANCSVGDGSEDMPYCEVGEALSNAGDELLIRIRAMTTLFFYMESNVVVSDVVVFSETEQLPVISGVDDVPAFTVAEGASLSLRGVGITGGGVRVNDGQLWLDETAIEQNDSVGLSMSGGHADIRRTQIVNNAEGAIVVDGGAIVKIENSFLGGLSGQPAMRLIDGTSTTLYTTIGVAPAVAFPAVSCADGVSHTIRNSLIVSVDDSSEVDCPGMTITDSALEMEMGDNTSLGDMDTAWFNGLAAGHLTLKANAYPKAIETAAVWRDGDPTTDIHGDPRPTVDGTSDFAGADRL